MIEQFAEKIADKLIYYNYIEDTQKDSYVYTMVISIETGISLITILVLSVYFRVTFSTIVFLIFLFGIKKRSGGFHADTYGKCFLLTIMIYIGFNVFLLPVMVTEMEVTYIVLGNSIIVLELIGAVNHPNMDWNKKEYLASKKASRKVVAIEGILIGLFALFNVSSELIVFMAFAVILSAFLLLIAKAGK